MGLALFDMDRTLVRKDTASLYVRYQRDEGRAGVKQAIKVAWWLLQYTAGVIDAERVAEEALADFKGKSEAWMRKDCASWFRTYVVPHISAAARQTVREHQERGDVVVIVTGATAYAAEPLARLLGIEHVICTRLEVDDHGLFSGRVVHPMCYGAGKITLAEAYMSDLGMGLLDASFYSDSITDRPLLEHVARPICVNPDRRLRNLAKKRGWEIQAW
jgi:HAD superfamily hydrolase (TIGR01490 family)